MGTAVPGVKKAPNLGRFSNVWNMETRVRSNEVGRPIARGAQLLAWTGCSKSQRRWPKGDRKADAMPALQWLVRITGRIPGPCPDAKAC